jgi:hypothetical protein
MRSATPPESPPAATGVGDPTAPTPLPTLTPAAEANSTWADLSRRLKATGVQRFWVEGEPGGTVRFRCILPIEGHPTVSQQFEAEGPSVVAAAESVLRRVTLWRATETP